MKRYRCILLLLAAGCGKSDSTDDAGAGVTVGVQAAALDSISEVLTLTGQLTAMPGGSAVLAAPADAIVQSIRVQLGDRVGRGQLLIQLDAPELTTAAQSLTAQARSDSMDLERQRGLYQQGIAARRQLEEREAAAASSRAQADAAMELLRRARVTSPISGGIQRLLVQVGERVSAGQTLIEVVNGTGLDFHAGVPAAALNRVRLGQAVALQGEGLDRPVAGRLVAIAPAVDSSSGMGEVVVRAPLAGGLRVGSGATGALQLRVLRDVLVISDSALVPGEGSLQVFVVGADSIARARAVTVQVRNAGRAAVSGEIHQGDRVVVSGAYGLTDSTRVVPIATP
ncbi:MAG TPA: efflux RND transporter periplasmic adaptor subunit [Gemmatimonadales bacterium]|nr:efflux RND transporter periplasmic adaptor subunit [Gemmatimonadales bacterium]